MFWAGRDPAETIAELTRPEFAAANWVYRATWI